MLTALALDDFVGAAYAAVHDTPEFNPANEGEFVFHTPEPVLVLPQAQDLSLLGEELFGGARGPLPLRQRLRHGLRWARKYYDTPMYFGVF